MNILAIIVFDLCVYACVRIVVCLCVNAPVWVYLFVGTRGCVCVAYAQNQDSIVYSPWNPSTVAIETIWIPTVSGIHAAQSKQPGNSSDHTKTLYQNVVYSILVPR